MALNSMKYDMTPVLDTGHGFVFSPIHFWLAYIEHLERNTNICIYLCRDTEIPAPQFV